MFSEASNVSAGVDKVFAFIIIVSAIFLIGITAFIIYMLVRFSRKKNKAPMQFTDNIKLEILWTAVPTILVLFMFYYGWMAFAPMRKAPKDAMEVTVIGRMWEWEFIYGENMSSKELVLPVNKAVRLNLKSPDVNHGLFIPAFRVKEDVVPGYNNYMWFIPQYIGNYELLCTQYCGMLHANMLSKVVVLEQPEYDKWFAELKEKGKIEEHKGLIIARNNGCLACHSLDGSRLVGPSFKNLHGSVKSLLVNGNTVQKTADDAYIEKSIYEPDAEVVSGYTKGIMKSYKDVLKPDEIKEIQNYLKTISENK